MTVFHHHPSENPSERLQLQTVIHHKCLLLLLARPGCTAVQSVRPAERAVGK